ncbi:MAG: DUF2298 domain-containing protein [Dehalococcoidia bacterium]
MAETVRWLLAAEVIGLAALPLAWWLFPRLRDGGAGFAKPLGLLLVSFPVWLLGSLGAVPNTALAYWAALAVTGAVSLRILVTHRQQFRCFVAREWRALALGEALFLVFFIGWAVVRAYEPAIAGTEKPMDLLMLNAVSEAGHAPPQDPWLAGSTVAYYYFGYWMMGVVGTLSAVPTAVGYNLSLALTAGMAASAVFSVAYGLISPGRIARARALPVAAAAAGLLLLAANFAGVWELAAVKGLASRGFFEWLSIDGVAPGSLSNAWRPDGYWWWWHASRVINTFQFGAPGGIDFTIQEFPFFSLLLGDLHPHVLSIPFLLTALGLTLNLFLTPGAWRARWLIARPARWALLALVTGALGFINAWDLGFGALLLLALITVKAYRERGGALVPAVWHAATVTTLIVAAGMLLFSPFYFGTFSSQVQWSEPVGAVRHATRPVHMLTVWGLFAVLLAPLFVTVAARALRPYGVWIADTFWRTPSDAAAGTRRPARGPLWLAVGLVAAPYFLWAGIHMAANEGARGGDMFDRALAVFPLALLAAASLLAAFHAARRARSDSLVFATTLLALVLYLLYGTELLFIHDLFGNRMNTVFKVYYQVWIVLGALGAYGIHYWLAEYRDWVGWPRALGETGAVVAAVLVAGALYYPAAALDTRTNGFSGERTLDGIAYIGKSQPAELEAIRWLADNAPSGSVLVEAVGGGYSEFGRVAATTGLPTVLGWPGHEQQWRGSTEPFEGREADVERIYSTRDMAEARQLLDRYGARYVVIGPRERQRYPGLDPARFAEIGDLVFPEGATPAAIATGDAVGIFDVRRDSSGG